MVSSEMKKKCQYSINLLGGEWKLNLVTRRASNKMFEKSEIDKLKIAT